MRLLVRDASFKARVLGEYGTVFGKKLVWTIYQAEAVSADSCRKRSAMQGPLVAAQSIESVLIMYGTKI